MLMAEEGVNLAGRLKFCSRASGLNVELSKTSNELVESFRGLKTPKDVSALLEVTHRDFNYWIYRTPESKRYITFSIDKKSGGRRRIDAPTTNVKILQQKLNQVLQSVYQSKPSVHGFVEGKSVRSNAESHVRKSWVLNLDLEDFFPSINFGRVRGMFMAQPYLLPRDVATVLAHLCCYKGYLPQGAPTSPVVSNMICAKMDSQLQRLAQQNRSTYTRYADDISFSTTMRIFPRTLAYLDHLKQIQPGSELNGIVQDNGFSINAAKVWLRGRNNRQTVTGVTVNEFPNLPRKYTKPPFTVPVFPRNHSSPSVYSSATASPKPPGSYEGRISISLGPGIGLGQRLTYPKASSISLTSHSQKPAINSPIAAKGPSMTVGAAPSKATRLPWSLSNGPGGVWRKPSPTTESKLWPPFPGLCPW